MIRWSDAERKEFEWWLESGWDWYFPGYKQGALFINSIYHNNRTPTACKMMSRRVSQFRKAKQIVVSK